MKRFFFFFFFFLLKLHYILIETATFVCQQRNVVRMFKRFSTFQNIGKTNDQRFGMYKNAIIDSQTTQSKTFSMK